MDESLIKVRHKWGFGMSIPKPHTRQLRRVACETFVELLGTDYLPNADEVTLDVASTVKGLFNRVVKEDQWDWFTVQAQLGYPSRTLASKIVKHVRDLRTAIKIQDFAEYRRTRIALCKLPTRRCLQVFLGNRVIKNEPNCGWVYVLATKRHPHLLKIGATTRTVEQRVAEINCATGVVVPYGVRRCWRVLRPFEVEKEIHKLLWEHRIRSDREFFAVDFQSAATKIYDFLRLNNYELRTLDNLGALQSSPSTG